MVVMMVATTAAVGMDMAVGDFFFGGGTYIDHLHAEVQRLARQRMVAVNHYAVVQHFGNLYRALTHLGFGDKTHARHYVFDITESGQRHFLTQAVVIRAIGLLTFYGDIQAITCLFALKGCFQTRDQVFGTVEVNHGFAFKGTFQQLTLLVGQAVVDGYRCVLGDLHIASASQSGAMILKF